MSVTLICDKSPLKGATPAHTLSPRSLVTCFSSFVGHSHAHTHTDTYRRRNTHGRHQDCQHQPDHTYTENCSFDSAKAESAGFCSSAWSADGDTLKSLLHFLPPVLPFTPSSSFHLSSIVFVSCQDFVLVLSLALASLLRIKSTKSRHPHTQTHPRQCPLSWQKKEQTDVNNIN